MAKLEITFRRMFYFNAFAMHFNAKLLVSSKPLRGFAVSEHQLCDNGDFNERLLHRIRVGVLNHINLDSVICSTTKFGDLS